MGTVLLSYAKGEVQLLEVLLRKKKKKALVFSCVLQPVAVY